MAAQKSDRHRTGSKRIWICPEAMAVVKSWGVDEVGKAINELIMGGVVPTKKDVVPALLNKLYAFFNKNFDNLVFDDVDIKLIEEMEGAIRPNH